MLRLEGGFKRNMDPLRSHSYISKHRTHGFKLSTGSVVSGGNVQQKINCTQCFPQTYNNIVYKQSKCK